MRNSVTQNGVFQAFGGQTPLVVGENLVMIGACQDYGFVQKWATGTFSPSKHGEH